MSIWPSLIGQSCSSANLHITEIRRQICLLSLCDFTDYATINLENLEESLDFKDNTL